MIDADKYQGHAYSDPSWEWTGNRLYSWVSPEPLVMRLENEWERDEATMQLIADSPLLLAEVKRAYQLIVDAAWQLHWNVGTIAASDPMSSKEWDENIHAPAQAWRRQVQDILDASEEGCPWRESE